MTGADRRRYRVALGLALSAVLALAACTGIPDSGAVEQQVVSATPNDGDVIFQPSGPIPNATQTQILYGFLQAAASPQDDYKVARQFLTKGLSKDWDPNAGVLITSGQPALTTISESSMTVGVTPTAEVDSTGEFVESASSAAVTLPFSFIQEDGQWRISMANPGIILQQLRFDQVFSSHALYFFDTTYTYLVPDVRWFAKDQTTSTRVVKALLGGPTPWLGQGAVVTAFPDGTETTSVVVNSGQANVPLTNQVLSQSQQTLQRMQAQLDASLGTVAQVSSVIVTVNQNPVTIVQASPPLINPQVDARALIGQAGAFGYAANGALVPVPSLSDKVVALGPLSVTSSAKVYAVGTASGVYAVQSGSNTPALVDSRAGLVAPSLDPEGYVWTVPAASAADVQAYGSDGIVHPVATNWVGLESITSIDVSRDGTRVLAFGTADGAPHLVVAAILRDKDGVPTKLGTPVTLATGSGVPLDATWVDQSSVASLTLSASGTNRVVLQQIGGVSSDLGVPTGAASLAGGNDVSGLWLLTTTGELQQQRGSGWQTTSTAVSFLATQT